jgi:hypothetical protein
MDNRRPDQPASPRRRLLALVVLLAPLTLGACAASPRGPSAAAPREPIARAQGSAWETVLPTPDLARWRQAYAPWELPEYARRDGDISARSPRLATALDQWPDPTPTVVFPRYLTLPRHPDRVLIFVPVPVHGHRPRY